MPLIYDHSIYLFLLLGLSSGHASYSRGSTVESEREVFGLRLSRLSLAGEHKAESNNFLSG